MVPIVPTGPLLELCVLAALKKEPLYGYQLTKLICKPFMLSESTLYPILRRLHANGCLDVFETIHNGRTRRYYALSRLGIQRLKELETAWNYFDQNLNAFLKGCDGVE